MAYLPFVDNKPIVTDAGQDVVDDTRENLEALRDAVIMGTMPDWKMDVTIGTGTASEPQFIAWRNGNGSGDLEVRAEITWGTSGGPDGNPVTIDYDFTGDRTQGTPTYVQINIKSISYDGNGNVESEVWT